MKVLGKGLGKNVRQTHVDVTRTSSGNAFDFLSILVDDLSRRRSFFLRNFEYLSSAFLFFGLRSCICSSSSDIWSPHAELLKIVTVHGSAGLRSPLLSIVT